MMSRLFSVSTDYLLKEDMEPEIIATVDSAIDRTMRYVSMEEANAFMKMEEEQSKSVAFGVMLCILSPVLLIFLNGLAETYTGGILETIAGAIGLIQLFGFVTIAVFLFISYAGKMSALIISRRKNLKQRTVLVAL